MDDPTRSVTAPDATRSVADPNVVPGPIPTVGPSPGADRYTLAAEIARGAMGEVYRATDTALGREVAVKVLQAKYGPGSGTARRFHDEARIAAQLQHPGIPPRPRLGYAPRRPPVPGDEADQGADA